MKRGCWFDIMHVQRTCAYSGQQHIPTEKQDYYIDYSVMYGNEQLFATRGTKLYLPTKEELKAEIETPQKAMFLSSAAGQ
ncbi:MAG: hypothetical protein ACLU00_10305 [Mediterraneibacter faecis]